MQFMHVYRSQFKPTSGAAASCTHRLPNSVTWETAVQRRIAKQAK